MLLSLEISVIHETLIKLILFGWFVCIFIFFQSIKEKRWRKAVICGIIVLVPIIFLGLLLAGYIEAGF